MFIVLARTWDKEKILSPHEGSNLRPSDSALRCSATMMDRHNHVTTVKGVQLLSAKLPTQRKFDYGFDCT